MKHLKLFEAFKSKFDPYQEVSQVEYENWCDSHNTENFKKSDTLATFEIVDSLWKKGASTTLAFFNKNHRIETPVSTLYKDNQIWDMTEEIFSREPFSRIEVYDDHHYFQIEKWEDEWYTAFYDTYGGGQPHYFIVDTQDGIDWLQDKMSTIYSDVYEGGIDESKETVMMGTLTNKDNELIEDLILDFVEKWKIENSKFKETSWSLDRFDRFQIWLKFTFVRSMLKPEMLSEMKSMIERIRKFGYNVNEHSMWNHIGDGQKVYTFTISHKVEESLSDLKKSDEEKCRSILEDVSDIFLTPSKKLF